MPGSLRIVALDTVLELNFAQGTPNAFRDAVAHAWSRCLVDLTASAGESRRTADPLQIPAPAVDDEAIRAALQRLSQDVTHRLIAAQTGRLLMFHAGAVSDPKTGASVVFVAPSGTGKTTLSRLLGATHGYLTDETVGVEPASGLIHPYPKPLSISSADRWRKVETSPDHLGLLPAPLSPTVARIGLLSRSPDQGAPVQVDELGTLDAVAALIPETSALNRLPRPLHTVADLLERTGPLVRLTYREATDLVPLVSRLFEETP